MRYVWIAAHRVLFLPKMQVKQSRLCRTMLPEPIIYLRIKGNLGIVVFWAVHPLRGEVKVNAVVTRLWNPKSVVFELLWLVDRVKKQPKTTDYQNQPSIPVLLLCDHQHYQQSRSIGNQRLQGNLARPDLQPSGQAAI